MMKHHRGNHIQQRVGLSDVKSTTLIPLIIHRDMDEAVRKSVSVPLKSLLTVEIN